MTIWTPRQMQQVMGLRANMRVDPDALRQGVGVRDSIRSRLTFALQHHAHPLGVDLDPEDVHVVETPPDTEDSWGPWVFDARWMPGTRQVELLGGPEDGKQYGVAANLWQPLFIATQREALFDLLVTHRDAPVGATLDRHVYHLETWNETARLWVFRYGGET